MITTEEFNTNLHKLLCSESFDTEDDPVDEKICLISNIKLEETPVKLCCGHTFNYDSIFNEIKQQKNIYPNSNIYLETQKLNVNQIKCPYCRTVQNGLIPYRKDYPRLQRVNWPPKYHYLPNSCIYKFLSGKRKNTLCNKKCSESYCPNHFSIIEKRTAKIEAKKAKLKAKEEKKKAKKATNNVVKFVNPFTVPSVANSNCQYIFKRGSKKNTKCTCKKIFKNNLCKTHHNQLFKKLKTQPQWHSLPLPAMGGTGLPPPLSPAGPADDFLLGIPIINTIMI